MAGRDLLTEITEVKRRKPKEARGLHYEFERLERQWKKATEAATQDFYPIRTVTLLEVFTRTWAAKLIDHGVPSLGHHRVFSGVASRSSGDAHRSCQRAPV
jgi:hypothetical protein